MSESTFIVVVELQSLGLLITILILIPPQRIVRRNKCYSVRALHRVWHILSVIQKDESIGYRWDLTPDDRFFSPAPGLQMLCMGAAFH